MVRIDDTLDVLNGKKLFYVLEYLVEIVIFSNHLEDNLKHLQEVFMRLWNAGSNATNYRRFVKTLAR